MILRHARSVSAAMARTGEHKLILRRFTIDPSLEAFTALERRLGEAKPVVKLKENANTGPPKEPVEPDPSECCGNDCPNCVWITYFDELSLFQEYQKSQGK
eukprot:gb/GEZN01008310.1/.p1 GENE.gb/GEZN01008310.1/~~gb/GEZN01008310.1/.p1  ORF type:complete len:101 (-),score=9.96 gb/GEZN01008310.1/:1141-1443(-)